MAKIPKVPEEVEKILDVDERIIYGCQQSRVRPTWRIDKAIGKAVAPDSLWITNKRVIVFKPSALTLGITKDIQDFPYRDMMNVMQHKGFLSSRIAIKMRLLSHPVFLDFIPKGDVMRVYRIIREQISKWERGELEEMKTTAPKAPKDISPIEQIKKLAELRDAGIISEEEFQSKKKELLEKI